MAGEQMSEKECDDPEAQLYQNKKTKSNQNYEKNIKNLFKPPQASVSPAPLVSICMQSEYVVIFK